ncbi:MAG: helix-turn-helix transcriptional regulator [Betaproteobacteria bacterium]
MDFSLPIGVIHDSALYALPELLRRGRFSKSHLYNLMERNCFPRPTVVLGSRFTRWSAEECDRWFANPNQWIESQKGGVK